jgi:hypothetical protein
MVKLKYETQKNKNGEHLVIGCNYHTTWQSHRNMRFVLSELKFDKALLTTRHTRKSFWCSQDDLIFITSNHNIRKANNILETLSKKKVK